MKIKYEKDLTKENYEINQQELEFE